MRLCSGSSIGSPWMKCRSSIHRVTYGDTPNNAGVCVADRLCLVGSGIVASVRNLDVRNLAVRDHGDDDLAVFDRYRTVGLRQRVENLGVDLGAVLLVGRAFGVLRINPRLFIGDTFLLHGDSR